MLRCVGVGKCRRPHDAFMCPSFLATREELHTTRGRARMLFEMFRGEVITGRWRSKEVRAALELCLGCKGCVRECPVNVNIPAYKSEFLSHYYGFRPRPMSAYALGLMGYWTALTQRTPWLVNAFAHTPVVRAAAPETRIIAEGYSCRKQIEDGTGRKAQHLSEVIWQALRKEV